MEDAIATLRAFADETRIRILHLVREEEHCVAELVETLQISQPLVSKHLAQLRAARLVACRSDGPWRYYRLAKPVSSLHGRLLEGILDDLGRREIVRQDARRLRKVMKYLKCCLKEPVATGRPRA